MDAMTQGQIYERESDPVLCFVHIERERDCDYSTQSGSVVGAVGQGDNY
jgi:hypothetical protein